MSIYVAPRLAPPVEKASPIGPGSGVLQTEFPLGMNGIGMFNGSQTPQRKMAKAWQLGIEVPWIRAAERSIGGKVQSLEWHLEDADGETVDDDYLEWHLEDADGETVDDDYDDPQAQAAKLLIEKPQAALGLQDIMFRSDLWRLTMRHIGLCGNAFWYLDQQNAYGIPKGVLYIRPDRMTPVEDDNGNLTGWLIDNAPGHPGIGVRIDEVIHFVLDPPDVGHFGIGLVESAILKAQNSVGLDRHVGMLISAGGRLSGVMSPKTGIIAPEQMAALERDWRTVVEQSDAAKRLQIVAAPLDFTKTTLSPGELQIRDMMQEFRDDLLGLWGVPLSKLGIHDRGRGLGASGVTNNDDETLWVDAVVPRTTSFAEQLQYRLIDPWSQLGTTLSLVLDIPSFDDDAPRYDAILKAIGAPLTVNQRLLILGQDPVDDTIISPMSGKPLGYDIILPATSVLYANATPPAEEPYVPEPEDVAEAKEQTAPSSAAAAAAGETPEAGGAAAKAAPLKPHIAALSTSLRNLRANMTRHATPRIRQGVSDVLAEQKSEIVARLRKHADLIAKRPADTTVWFDQRKWDTKMTAAIRPHAAGMAEVVNATITDALPAQKAAPVGAVERVLTRGAARVTGINDTTRTKINDAIIRGLEAGLSVTDVANLIEGIGSADIGLDPATLFDESRAETIARTELMDAYNASALGTYADGGIEQVQAIDGDGDPECAERDGQTFSVDEADTIEDHPNGTLDWVPILPEEEAA